MQKYILLSALKKLVEADFKSVKTKFIKQDIEETEVKKYLDLFKELRDTHRITKADEKNIDYWGKKPFEEFKSFLEDLAKASSKSQIKKDSHVKHQIEGAEFITENSEWLVYRIDSYKASDLLGSREWCIVRKEEDFISHSKEMTFYYILSKTRAKEDKWYKIALGVDSKGKKLYWDNFDEPNDGASSIPSDLKIPTFKTEFILIIKIEDKSYTEKEFYKLKNLNVKGNLFLYNITSLPDNLKVGGFLNLENTKITSLPDNLTVGGFLDLSNTEITSLPDNLKVGGSLYLKYTKITSLPDNLKVDGDLYLEYTQITSLPENLTVGGSLNLSNTKITSLPENLQVGGSLYLKHTPITSLPDNLKVGGSLDLQDTKITSLPENLNVGFGLYLNNTKITSLPENLKVGGSLDLRKTQITSLPDNIKVSGGLYLSDSKITSLPENLKVGGDLDLSYTPITSLPDNLKVGGYLYLYKTPITSLPDNLQVGVQIYVDDPSKIKCSEKLKKKLV